MLQVQQANDVAVKFLNNLGYRSGLFQATIKKKKIAETLTVPNTFECQEQLAASAQTTLMSIIFPVFKKQ